MDDSKNGGFGLRLEVAVGEVIGRLGSVAIWDNLRRHVGELLVPLQRVNQLPCFHHGSEDDLSAVEILSSSRQKSDVENVAIKSTLDDVLQSHLSDVLGDGPH